MDKDILISILNRLEGKVDILSTGLATNTAETTNHTHLLNEMKNTHDINAKIIIDTNSAIKEVKNEVLKINSWKNGQILYQTQNLEDIKNLHDRLSPIEADFISRLTKKKETEKNWSAILWSGIEKVVLIVAGAILISWREIFNNVK